MRNKGFVVMLLALSIAGCSDGRPEWMKTALDDDVDQARWEASSLEEKVATAGLWLQRLNDDDYLSLAKPAAEMEPEANALATCIDSSLEEATAESATGVRLAAADCVHELGYAKKVGELVD
ncbi:hypothetical protein L861_05055 [Litchfieldella anticariensis FP35 = DSM 16096]|uniref:Uncharacterized protein n=1 Tax=Litchfieldella anticariensis (strain DSM 16096 / CECT 5854 / CIP 108499 / LMG 22089 / FP35) TaxID=1121939 RepID=S2KNT2_LITA3|nr:hypothetical protein [Halomonas anticariensis]EPC02128.1 hypothetical protein L861_05055 [Halomonas anticariensis FP35 = DSM 16096]